jgi:hypothetical protein
VRAWKLCGESTRMCLRRHESSVEHSNFVVATRTDVDKFSRDHAMCNILNRNISVVHLQKIQKLFIINCHSQLLALTPTSSLQVVAQTMDSVRGYKVSFGGTCSRCLIFSPLPLSSHPKGIDSSMRLSCEVGCRLYNLKILCLVSSTDTKFMQSGVWRVCTPAQ